MGAQDLEDRVARIGCRRQRRGADLLDDEIDARGSRRAVTPAAHSERGVDVGDCRQRVGVGEGRQHEQAGALVLDRREVGRRPGDRQIGDRGRAGYDNVRAAVVMDGYQGRVDTRIGVDMGGLDVEYTGVAVATTTPVLSGEPSPQSMVVV